MKLVKALKPLTAKNLLRPYLENLLRPLYKGPSGPPRRLRGGS